MRMAIIRELNKIYPTFNIGKLSAEKTKKKPFITVNINNEVHTMRGSYKLVSLYIYSSLDAPLIIDNARKKVVDLLHKKILNENGQRFILEYQGLQGEFVDEKLGCLVCLLEFRIPYISM